MFMQMNEVKKFKSRTLFYMKNGETLKHIVTLDCMCPHDSRGREWSENCDNKALFEMQGKPSPIIFFNQFF
jgi:hypothetical protein